MPRKKLYRVKVISAVILPGSTHCTVPNPSVPYEEDDPLVIAYPWMFEADEDVSREAAQTESASAEPERPRRVGRPPLPRDSRGNVVRD